MFFFVTKLNLNFDFEPSKHIKVAILFANSFPIVFNVALVSNVALFFWWAYQSLTYYFSLFFYLLT